VPMSADISDSVFFFFRSPPEQTPHPAIGTRPKCSSVPSFHFCALSNYEDVADSLYFSEICLFSGRYDDRLSDFFFGGITQLLFSSL